MPSDEGTTGGGISALRPSIKGPRRDGSPMMAFTVRACVGDPSRLGPLMEGLRALMPPPVVPSDEGTTSPKEVPQ